jgi:hypothetical protein
MSKLSDAVLALLTIGTLTTGIARAQQVLTVPLDSQPVPSAAPANAPTIVAGLGLHV